ncbi:MAG: hypothetical protein ACRC4X_03420, partial [Cetobacterium sp.]
AAGKITNVADILNSAGTSIAEEKSDNTTTVNPLPAIVQILKTVDKSTYVSGDTLTYKITVGNTGTGWANGIRVTDAIDAIKDKIYDEQNATYVENETAFASWTISAAPSAGSGTVVLGTNVLTASTALISGGNPDPSLNLDARVSLAPMSGIEFTIVAKLNTNLLGDIINKASYKYDPANPNTPTIGKDSEPVITKPKATDLTITKLQSNVREKTEFTQNPIQYWLEDTILYQIIVKNGENAIASVTIEDKIKDILVGGSGGNNIPAYSQWVIDNIVYSDGTAGPINKTPASLLIPSVDNIKVVTSLKANETVTITIRAKITAGDMTNKNFPQSVIKNTASITANGKTDPSNEVIFTPYPPVLERLKVITSIGGVPYTPGMTYSPGDVVVYTIGIRNTGNGVADNITVKDDLSTVVTELAG